MVTDTQSRSEPASEPGPRDGPVIRRCESRPGTSVFLESGNTDGWIASDVTVDVLR